MIGLKIKEIREKKKLSKEFVAIQMEMSITEYNKLEKENADFKISKLDKLVKILDSKKSDIFAMYY